MDHYIHIGIAPVEETLVLSVFHDTEWKRWDLIDIPPEFVDPDGVYHLAIVGRGEEIFIFLDDVSVAVLRESEVINPGCLDSAWQPMWCRKPFSLTTWSLRRRHENTIQIPSPSSLAFDPGPLPYLAGGPRLLMLYPRRLEVGVQFPLSV